jgi:hypothetical protein
MTSKTELWDRLGKTDPKHTKGFKRAGGFSGTAIKPIYSYRRMTEEYGPCGVGWGVGEPSFQVVPGPEGEVLVYCTVSIWHGDRANLVFGVGGDKAVGKNKYGLSADDEAFKKAFTDAVTNALKLIGVGADVHMGLFEDNKYLTEVKAEFDRQSVHETLPEDIGPVSSEPILKKDDNIQTLTVEAQKPIFSALTKELEGCVSIDECKRWKVSARTRASRLSENWRKMLEGLYLTHLRALEKRDADEYIERATG